MSSKSYQEKQQARLEQAMATLKFEEDVFGLFATVPSTSSKIGVYSVEINAATLYSVSCNCKAGKANMDCIHQLAADRKLDAYRPTFKQQCNGVTASRETIDRLLGIEAVTASIGEVMADADTAMRVSEVEAWNEQYAYDPRVGLTQEEIETADANYQLATDPRFA